MSKFLSCDWGSSSFRIRLVDSEGLNIIAEQRSGEGILKTHARWKENGPDENMRMNFYFAVIQRHIDQFPGEQKRLIDRCPLVISGMACSNLGMIELPYKEFPFAIDGSDLITHIAEASDAGAGPLIFVSGTKTGDDAMRGEETLLVGCHGIVAMQEPALFIFPGTHSKHVRVSGGRAIGLKTFMTGEFFDLLVTKSILAASVEKPHEDDIDDINFDQGVIDGAGSNIMHESFHVRTSSLFGKRNKKENYFYLSGLVIGSELSEFSTNQIAHAVIVSEERIGNLYERAIGLVTGKKLFTQRIDAGDAVVAGHDTILKFLKMQGA